MEYLYLLAARVFGAARGYSMKRASGIAPGAKNSLVINLIRSLICLAVSIPVFLLSEALPRGTAAIALALISGIFSLLQMFFWVIAVGYVSISAIEVFTMIGTVALPLLLSPILYEGESVSLLHWLGAALLLAAAILMSSDKKSEKRITAKGIILALLSAIGASGAAISQKLYSYHVIEKGDGGIAFFNLIGFAVAAAAFAIALAALLIPAIRNKAGEAKRSNALADFPYKASLGFIAFAALSLYAYQYFMTKASSMTSAVFYPLSYALGFLGGFALDTFFFGVKATRSRMLSALIVLISIILITI
ncbi:MAG: hypothetical protein IJY18_06220 [Clostridia bacterium]|nr:hypothetical protein [Clostridia bacterium]